jgi:hypothetical protein
MSHTVMRGLVPRIHAWPAARKDVDGRDEHGHDGMRIKMRHEDGLVVSAISRPAIL